MLAGTAVNMGNNKITNVAAGTADTDAVNVSQLKSSSATTLVSAKNYTNQGAAAIAVAGLPQATKPGAKMMAVAGGVYRGQSAVAVGFSG